MTRRLFKNPAVLVRIAVWAGVALTLPGTSALAQRQAGPGAAQPGLASGPITIDSDRLEVLDKEKRAVFSGNVVAMRGDMMVRSSAMIVFYDSDGTNSAAQAGPSGNQNVRRIEMTGKVFFSQRDQQATGDSAVYERASETLVLSGNVVLTQCQNVVTGPRLVVNLRTNQAQVEGAPGARVRSIIVPGDSNPPAGGKTGAPACAQPAAPSAPPPQPSPAVKRKS